MTLSAYKKVQQAKYLVSTSTATYKQLVPGYTGVMCIYSLHIIYEYLYAAIKYF